MNLYMDRKGITGVSGLFSVFGSFGVVEGSPADIDATRIRQSEDRIQATLDIHDVTLESDLSRSPEGIYVRTDTLTNQAEQLVVLHAYRYRFTLPGGEYDVYTQYNGWMNESTGGWQPLVARAQARNRGLRTAEGMSPMLALWNRQNGHGVVFHLFASCQWEISACLQPSSGSDSVVVVELGISGDALHLEVAAGECITLPRAVYYSFVNKADLDCYRLHEWYNRLYPRREMPVLFNTWLMCFDRIDPDQIWRQAMIAAEMGVEYFVIDAGWFGRDGRWSNNIGDWRENEDSAFRGRMSEFSGYVKSLGMKFGLWLEPERALANTPVLREHPEYFFTNGNSYFLDFARLDAREYITGVVMSVIARYGLDFIKFDFNDGISYDPSGSGFYRYFDGYHRFIAAIRAAHPDLYIENCASGGQRIDMHSLSLCDSAWYSDNQGLHDGVDLIAGTMRRLPPALLDRWVVARSAPGFISYQTPGKTNRLIGCNNGTWTVLRDISPSWLEGFLSGGACGLSCDLEELDAQTREQLTDYIARFKQNRSFWINALGTLLCDTPYLLAWQFSDPLLERSVVCVFVKKRRQDSVVLYPRVCADMTYTFGEERLSGHELQQDGLSLLLPSESEAIIIELNREG